MAVIIKLTSDKKNMPSTLNYIIIKPRQNINLNIFESEKYEPAIIVQQLVGNLIYYSNKGRYEPRLAEKWEILANNSWAFTLRKNLKCENGEDITPKSFKESLDRSIYIYSKLGGVPIMTSLIGYKKFLEENSEAKSVFNLKPLMGITFDENRIIFEFDKKIKSGLLQILSFTPFGYISDKNFNSDGTWKNNKTFISSGPYKVDKLEFGISYSLSRNQYWPLFSKSAPEHILFTHNADQLNPKEPTVIDAFTNEYNNSILAKYKLVPEYINSILLGNYKSGYFSELQNRLYIRHLINELSKEILPNEFGINIRSNSFYPNQDIHRVDNTEVIPVAIPKSALIIEGSIPIEGTSRWYSWLLLKKLSEKYGYKFKFAQNESSFNEITNKNYDLRLRGSSIGGGVEAWGMYVSFCSAMGINFPDPSNRICNLIADYESDKIDDSQLTINFFKYIKEDSAILPISHYGVSLYLSDHIDISSISPLMSIMRIDQILLEK